MKLFTVPLGLGKFINWEFIEYHELSAAVSVSLIPTLLIYILLRRYIVDGVIASGIKM
jgi:multiple sugar transport system permease protein